MASVNRRKNVGSSSANESKESSEFNFIHFGCWNNDGCGDKYPSSGLSKTMEKLKTELPKINPKIVLVTGDNYYPLKTTEPESKITKKEFNQDVFDSGWDCLKSVLPADKTYVLLGNHDLEEKGKKEKDEKTKPEGASASEFESVKKEKPEKSEKKEKSGKSGEKCIIKDEFAHLAKSGFNLVDLCEVKIIDTTMFVMFTSSIFDTDLDFMPDWETNSTLREEEKEEQKKAAKKNAVMRACAQFIQAYSNGDFKDDKNLIRFREQATEIITKQVRESLAQYHGKITNLVFVCHDPLMSWKSKTKTDKTGVTKTKTNLTTFGGEQYMNLLCGIVDLVKPSPDSTYYLCADLHQYQSGNIHIDCAECKTKYQITQNISGTGGAEQDDQIIGDKYFKKSKPEDPNPFGKYKAEYTMSESDKRFGFTKATVQSDKGISFEFVPAETEPLVGGKRRKTKTTTKCRTKYVMKTTGKKW